MLSTFSLHCDLKGTNILSAQVHDYETTLPFAQAGRAHAAPSAALQHIQSQLASRTCPGLTPDCLSYLKTKTFCHFFPTFSET